MSPQSDATADIVFEHVSHGRCVLLLGTAFLACLFAVSIFTASEIASGSKLETFSETTAVGDTNYFSVPEPTVPPAEQAFTSKGRQLVLKGYEKAKIHDTDMIRWGQEDGAGHILYTPRGKAGQELFLKIDVGEYLPLQER